MQNSQRTTPSYPRRDFLAQSTVVAAGVAISPAIGQAADGAPLPLIDCHQHLWDLGKQKLPWLATAPEKLRRNFVLADYRDATAGTGITQAVYMEVDVAAEEKVQEGELLTEICRRGDAPTIAAVIGCIPDAPDFARYVARWKGNDAIKGMRQVLHAEHKTGRCLTPEFVAGVRELGRAGLSFDLCLRYTEIGDGVKLAKLCPDTNFILDHCGNVDIKLWRKEQRDSETGRRNLENWKKDLAALAALPNTICKISGIVAQAESGWTADDLAPAINACWDAFGPARVVFGSDWPVCLLGAKLADWVRALRQIASSRPLAEQRQLFRENALRRYGLTG